MSNSRVSITLDDDVLQFIDSSSDNRSSFINDILYNEKRRIFLKELAEAYEEESADSAFQEEVLAWDVAVADGLNA
ncbi:MAG: hypothetical protein AAGD09_03550 [Cyanobacteria bacterium P01_F01_bin.56]